MKLVAVDATIALLYLGCCLFALSKWLPEGVNRTFSEQTWYIALAGAAIAFLLVCLLLTNVKSSLARADFRNKRFSVTDVILVLLPMTPVIQYVIANQNILTVNDSVMTIGIFVSIALVLGILFPLLLAGRRSAMLIGLCLTFVLFNMGLLSEDFDWHNRGELVVQVGLFMLVFAVCAGLYRIKKTILYAGVVTYFLTNSATVLFATNAQSDETGQSTFVSSTTKNIQHTPDVFLLTYDSYVPNETMLQYGIDNSAQESFLQSKDFALYDGTYSVGSTSITSMGRMLGGQELRSAAGGSGDVQRMLKRSGYETHGIFQTDYFFRTAGSAYDHSIPHPGSSYQNLAVAILEGRFRFNATFDEQLYAPFIQYKRNVLGTRNEQPRFVYSHTGPWHSQNSGTCLTDETERFKKRLALANDEMKADLQTLIAANPDAIIIVNGDHGPYLTKNCLALKAVDFQQQEVNRLDIQDRFGTFLAIRWPQAARPRHDAITTLQDVFPVVFAYLFEDDDMLALKIESSVAPQDRRNIAGLSVEDGIIKGGPHDGERLFETRRHPASLAH